LKVRRKSLDALRMGCVIRQLVDASNATIRSLSKAISASFVGADGAKVGPGAPNSD
jgi:hypothetical protein